MSGGLAVATHHIDTSLTSIGGTVLGSLRQHGQAVTAYRQALALSSNFTQARLNLGHQLEQLGEVDSALEQWRLVDEQAMQTVGSVPLDLQLHAINNQARLLEQERHLNQAEACMVRSLELRANQPDVIQHYVHIRQKQCEWPVYQTVGDVTENQLMVNTSALATLSASDDPVLQLLAAQRFVNSKYPAAESTPLFDPQRTADGRLKIGYLSGDFCLHAMGLLIPELLERHDRTRFEVFGFCFSREDGTPQRQRLIDAMDHHIPIRDLDDTTAAQLIASHGIDVLIDLHGLSSGARPRILALRPAPVQIGYLGLPATSALPGVDYMIADDYVMPRDSHRFYTERALTLPTCYQVSDTHRTVAPIPSRTSVALPEDAFVYCAFNNNHKFSEPVFSTWMEILSAVQNSVLWLLADNEWAQENMLRCADRHGIERSRLIFAPRVAPADYLARFAVADLFLDTFPYNAGATASDVLWMGTPLLTRSGNTYISRMAGSLLTAVGLPDLITESQASYRELAITLGRQPRRIASYKRYLAEHGHESPLFNMPALVRDLEAGVEQLVRQRNPPMPLPAVANPMNPSESLVQALVSLTEFHGRKISADILFSTIGLPDPLGADHAIRALNEAGIRATLLERDLTQIHPLLLPVALLMSDGSACLLTRRFTETTCDGEPNELLEIHIPGTESITKTVTPEQLADQYSGHLIATSVEPVQSQSNNHSSQSLVDPNRHWLWGTIRRFLPYYRSTMIAALLSNVLMLVTGLITAVIFDKVIPHQAFVTLWALATGGLIAVVFDLMARQLRSHLIDTAGKKCDMIISTILFRQTLGVRLENRPESAGAHSHYMAQIEIVRDFFASATIAALTDLPFIALFIAMTFMIGGSMGWILVAAVPLLVGMALIMQRSLRRSMSQNMTHHADQQGLMVESLEGLEDLKACNAQGSIMRRFETATVGAANAAIRARRISSLTTNVSAVSQQLITLVILVWGVYLIDAGQLSPGAMIACVMFGARAVAPLSTVVSLASRFQGANAALHALNQIMAIPQERDSQREYVSDPAVSGEIGLRDVSFAYPPTGPDDAPQVLSNVSLTFAAGERAVILGRIGSGKSTVLRLLAGLYQPGSGMVEVDGMDLRQLDPADYRRHVGFVSQEPRLFKGSLRDNVLMQRASADSATLNEIASLTGLDQLIAGHPQGWEMPVGEMGALLSGGQRQLVALARCLVTRPAIVLMDEPTSSMDAQSERLFIERLTAAASLCTLIMVTHRPAVIELAERVCVIEAGRLILDGPRQAVLAALNGQASKQSGTPSPRTADKNAESVVNPATAEN